MSFTPFKFPSPDRSLSEHMTHYGCYIGYHVQQEHAKYNEHLKNKHNKLRILNSDLIGGVIERFPLSKEDKAILEKVLIKIGSKSNESTQPQYMDGNSYTNAVKELDNLSVSSQIILRERINATLRHAQTILFCF